MKLWLSSRRSEECDGERERERIYIVQSDRRIQDATCRSFSFTKGQGQALIISARDADSKELRGYGKHKK